MYELWVHCMYKIILALNRNNWAQWTGSDTTDIYTMIVLDTSAHLNCMYHIYSAQIYTCNLHNTNYSFQYASVYACILGKPFSPSRTVTTYDIQI